MCWARRSQRHSPGDCAATASSASRSTSRFCPRNSRWPSPDGRSATSTRSAPTWSASASNRCRAADSRRSQPPSLAAAPVLQARVRKASWSSGGSKVVVGSLHRQLAYSAPAAVDRHDRERATRNVPNRPLFLRLLANIESRCAGVAPARTSPTATTVIEPSSSATTRHDRPFANGGVSIVRANQTLSKPARA
jgi:hypothetical protein